MQFNEGRGLCTPHFKLHFPAVLSLRWVDSQAASRPFHSVSQLSFSVTMMADQPTNRPAKLCSGESL